MSCKLTFRKAIPLKSVICWSCQNERFKNCINFNPKIDSPFPPTRKLPLFKCTQENLEILNNFITIAIEKLHIVENRKI